MMFRWLKQYMPRGLYARALLILVLPVVTLQLVVSVVFIQRHFEGVTEQLTDQLSRALLISNATDDPAILDLLEFRISTATPSQVPDADRYQWYDFAGRVVIRELRAKNPDILRVDLPDDRIVFLYLQDGDDILRYRFSRDLVSAPNPHQLLVNMVFFGALMTFIAFLYLRNQLRPIARLSAAAEAFGRGRHIPYSPSGAVEVRAAGNAFLDMRNRIERQIEQRTMMLSGVSHDLRTPLTRLKLGLSFLEDEDREPLERDVEDMQRLIDAFLDFARGDSESGVAEKVDPDELVTGIVGKFQDAGQKVVQLDTEGQGEVSLKKTAMSRAIENLIGNAVRYGSTCEVSVSITERALRIRVEDDGPGIAPEQREEAVRPFVRLDPSRNQDRGSGVGLGLAIAADIARAHGGVLRLGESETLGGLRADIVIAR